MLRTGTDRILFSESSAETHLVFAVYVLHQIMCVPFMVSRILLNTVHVMVMQVSKSNQVDLIPDNILLSAVY